ncbi:Hypothetical predicted protein [Marmota monax]|uniref:Chemokine interleukin-8-like domain-containing protein n=1 Tax=Marmota monax TaxID=9995 RepID=A0A5E4CZG9_MARMO|nr:Hypothetical predicted protein [Marmota monax]
MPRSGLQGSWCAFPRLWLSLPVPMCRFERVGGGVIAGSFEDCCLGYYPKPKLAVLRRARFFRIQEVSGSCNLFAIIFYFHQPGKTVCGNPRDIRVQKAMRWVNPRLKVSQRSDNRLTIQGPRRAGYVVSPADPHRKVLSGYPVGVGSVHPVTILALTFRSLHLVLEDPGTPCRSTSCQYSCPQEQENLNPTWAVSLRISRIQQQDRGRRDLAPPVVTLQPQLPLSLSFSPNPSPCARIGLLLFIPTISCPLDSWEER